MLQRDLLGCQVVLQLGGIELDEQIPDNRVSPLEIAVGREAFERYEAALASLAETDREAVIARIELGCSYREIAELVGKPTEDAARLAVSRALTKVAALMSDTATVRPGSSRCS